MIEESPYHHYAHDATGYKDVAIHLKVLAFPWDIAQEKTMTLIVARGSDKYDASE